MTSLLATLLLSLGVSAAGARTRVEVSTTALLLSGRLTFNPARLFAPDVISDVTLHVTLLRLINKVRLEHVGDITAVLTANCRSAFGATCTPLVPMRISYGFIQGTLPRITGILLFVSVLFLIETAGQRCLYEGLVGVLSPENPARNFTPLPEADLVALKPELPLTTEDCPERGELIGTFVANPLVTIRLLER
jgi:hypothetical protein